ncbi:RsmE family RNA methyltransferase [Actinomycetota bacterium]
MSHPYFFIKSSQVTGAKILLSDKDELKHLCKVLRCKPGDIVYFSDNERSIYRARTLSIDKDEGLFEVEEKHDLEKSRIGKTLFQCILKKNAMELVIQKSVEIGVDSIIPVISSRVVPDISDRNKKTTRWQKIADEAAKQCKRQARCLIGEPIKITNIEPSSYDLFYVPHEAVSTIKGGDMVSHIISLEPPANIGVLIGPEGGLSEDEAGLLEIKGAVTTGLGKNILRAETASIYFLSILDYLVKSKKQDQELN